MSLLDENLVAVLMTERLYKSNDLKKADIESFKRDLKKYNQWMLKHTLSQETCDKIYSIQSKVKGLKLDLALTQYIEDTIDQYYDEMRMSFILSQCNAIKDIVLTRHKDLSTDTVKYVIYRLNRLLSSIEHHEGIDCSLYKI
jgi:site-specific recombinase XerD